VRPEAIPALEVAELLCYRIFDIANEIDLAAVQRLLQAVYAAADAPESALPGFWERLLGRAEEVAVEEGRAVILLDEAHLLDGWAARLKGAWDGFRRGKVPVLIVATGSSALHLAAGSRESVAGRYERLTLVHWSAEAVSRAFKLPPNEAAGLVVRMGSYPGALPLGKDVPRWTACVRDSILEPAIGRDLVALAAVRRPALLRQLFAVAAASPAQVVSLQQPRDSCRTRGRWRPWRTASPCWRRRSSSLRCPSTPPTPSGAAPRLPSWSR